MVTGACAALGIFPGMQLSFDDLLDPLIVFFSFCSERNRINKEPSLSLFESHNNSQGGINRREAFYHFFVASTENYHLPEFPGVF